MISFACAYLCSQWKLVMTLVIIIGLSIALPITSARVIARYRAELESRSVSPPLLVGARGDRFDLVLRSQFFVGELQQSLTYKEYDRLSNSNELVCAPLHLVHSAGQGRWPIVGTSSVYLNAQALSLKEGQPFVEVGTCVIGAEVAKQLNGMSAIKSDLQSTFGFGDASPYELKVVGVLKESFTPDDQAVFVSLETAWLLDGYGHLHQDGDAGTAVNRNSFLYDVEGSHVPQNSQTEITESNRQQIHFHGEQENYRISSVAVWPVTNEAGVLLRVNYQDNRTTQVVVPGEEFEKLMKHVVRVGDILDLVFVILLMISTMMVALSTAQSVQLRKKHLETMYYLGCEASKVRQLLFIELSMVAGLALVACTLIVLLLDSTAPSLLSIL
ncbi:MAG: hypothetical protein CMJ76_08035 [Planctomycetaceae bacterium]|nr:hypothetical protein [Planctomycetaceae bacterium]